MVKSLPAKVSKARPVKAFAGTELLETITVGMYSDPLMSIREYIQNAADAIDIAVANGILKVGEDQIIVKVSGKDRTLTVEDNGCGIPISRVERLLCSLGCSEKSDSQRGFRGIGRLGGLAYCKRLIFVTRASSKDVITEVEWDGSQLRKEIDESSGSMDLISAVEKLAKIRTRKAMKNDPEHFFRVTMEEVSRFYCDSLLNIKALEQYISSIAPVPYDESKFTFSDLVIKHFKTVPGWRSYNIYLNGRKIFKPYSDKLQLSNAKSDQIIGINFFDICDVDKNIVGKGWYAITGLHGAIRRAEKMRGIRVRQGNIEIGDEYFLENNFTEPRFAIWHIGELELMRSVRPNARRDGFEQTKEYERILAYMSILGKKLSAKCRAFSRNRSQEQKLMSICDKVQQIISSSPVFIDYDHVASVTQLASELLDKVRPVALDGKKDTFVGKRYRALSRRLRVIQTQPPIISDCIDGRLLGKGCTKKFLEELCRRVIDKKEYNEIAPTVLSRMLTPYLKESYRDKNSGRRNGNLR